MLVALTVLGSGSTPTPPPPPPPPPPPFQIVADGGASAHVVNDEETIRRLCEGVKFFHNARSIGRADLQEVLQRHHGGTKHLTTQYHRKRTPGWEHLIVNNPPRQVLLAAWAGFLDAGGGDESELYTEDELIIPKGGGNHSVAGSSVSSTVGQVEELESGDVGGVIDPYMQSEWVGFTTLRLEKWRGARAKDVLETVRYNRERLRHGCRLGYGRNR